MSTELIDVTIVSNSETNDIQIIENKIVNVFHTEVIEPKPEFITPHQYIQNPNCMNGLKLSQIRETLKFYKNSMVVPTIYSAAMKRSAKSAIKTIHDFALVGTKQVLLERLKRYMNQDTFATQLQRTIRGVFVRRAISLRGAALHNRNMCVNDTDFYSLEPLENIPFCEFFSYTDKNKFTYGFELESLIMYIKRRTRNIKNPYNRDNMDDIVKSIRKLERLTSIINTHYVPMERTVIAKIKPKPVTSNGTRSSPSIRTPQNTSRTSRPQSTHIDAAMIAHIRNVRSKPHLERATLLFMDIDQLGNYTQHQWFTDLDRRNCLRFYRILKDIWTYRAQIPSAIKSKICPLWDPFIMLSSNSIDIPTMTSVELQNVCLTIMEDMVYTGTDTEFRTIGAFHVLSALTVVNNDARVNMPWLYESLVW